MAIDKHRTPTKGTVLKQYTKQYSTKSTLYIHRDSILDTVCQQTDTLSPRRGLWHRKAVVLVVLVCVCRLAPCAICVWFVSVFRGHSLRTGLWRRKCSRVRREVRPCLCTWPYARYNTRPGRVATHGVAPPVWWKAVSRNKEKMFWMYILITGQWENMPQFLGVSNA